MKEARSSNLLIIVRPAIQWMAVVVSLVSLSTASLAQVEIVESYPTIRGNSQQTAPSANSTSPNTRPVNGGTSSNVRPITEISEEGSFPVLDAADASDFYADYQRMQLELSQLRGMTEELTHEVKKLKQQRLDDYVELDKRIAELSAGGASSRLGSSVAIEAPASGSSRPATAAGANEVDSYKAALNKLLQSKDYDGAVAAFNQHLEQFPGGQYEVNVLFWLGQIFVIQGKPSDAENSYKQLIGAFPQHEKAWEARFALGKIYFQQGKKADAGTILREVAGSTSDVAGLARNYIQDNSL